MIGEQLAGTATTRRKKARWAVPAVAGRRHLATLMGDSTLVQAMLAMSFVALAALLYLAQASQADVLQLNIGALQQERYALNAQNASLHAQATTLQSLQRIDNAAQTQLHMTRPDLSTAIWVSPILPTVPSVHSVDAGTLSAEHASQPLAQIENFIAFVRSSL